MRTLSPASPSQAVHRWRLDIAYDGTNFNGWAAQPGLRTVESVVHEAITLACAATVRHLRGSANDPVVSRLVCAGRTDAGVHARGQVAHVDIARDVAAQIDTEWVRYRCAGLLDDDIVIRRVQSVTLSFDARFSALSRHYSYRISDSPKSRDPLLRHGILNYPRTLDVGAMNEAAAALLGRHDFAAFCRPRPYGTSIRRVLGCRWERDARGLVVLHIQADGFCHSMVRSIVGALVAVGEGRREPPWLEVTLAGRQRDPDIQSMPARGLTLERVRYPPPNLWAERQAVTRSIRQHEPRCEGAKGGR